MAALKRYWPLAVLVAAGAAALAAGAGRYLTLAALVANQSALLGFTQANLALSLAAFIGLYALVTATSIPGALVMTLAGGWLFGTWPGGAASVIGATIGAMVVFLAVRGSLGASLRERAEKSGGRLKAIIVGINQGAFGYILTLRLIPLAPFWLVNVAAALAGAPTRAYAVTTFIGVMPATFIYSSIGAGIGGVIAQGKTPDLGMIFKPAILVPLVALAALSLGATLYQRFHTRRARP